MCNKKSLKNMYSRSQKTCRRRNLLLRLLYRTFIVPVFVPGTKTEIIMVTMNVKVNSEDDTFSAIGCNCNQKPSKVRPLHITKLSPSCLFFLQDYAKCGDPGDPCHWMEDCRNMYIHHGSISYSSF
jgi:hypothetical protein